MSEKKGLITKRIVENPGIPSMPGYTNTSIPIGKTVETPAVPPGTGTGEETGTAAPRGEFLTMQEIARWLMDFLGPGVFRHIKDNPNFSLPVIDDTSTGSLEGWLVNAIKTLLPYDDIVLLGKNLRERLDTLDTWEQRLLREKKNLEQRLNRQEIEAQQITGERDAVVLKLHQMRRHYQASIPLKILIENFIDNETGKNSAIIELLNEALENPTENTPLFVVRWCRGWAELNPLLRREYNTEEEQLSMVYDTLTVFLSRLSGLFIPQRRPLLKELAKILSRELTTYEFLSPEETRQVDPAVHVAPQTGGTTIKEGISFTVIRKTTRQTVRYAQVHTQ